MALTAGTVTLLSADRVEYTTRLTVIICYRCAVPFAMPDRLDREARADPEITFYCPNGHGQCYRESEADKLRRQLDAAKRRANLAESTASAQRRRAVQAEGSNRALKGVITRERKRVGRGVCPCCNRTFANLTRHMGSKHPDYAGSEPS